MLPSPVGDRPRDSAVPGSDDRGVELVDPPGIELRAEFLIEEAERPSIVHVQEGRRLEIDRDLNATASVPPVGRDVGDAHPAPGVPVLRDELGQTLLRLQPAEDLHHAAPGLRREVETCEPAREAVEAFPTVVSSGGSGRGVLSARGSGRRPTRHSHATGGCTARTAGVGMSGSGDEGLCRHHR